MHVGWGASCNAMKRLVDKSEAIQEVYKPARENIVWLTVGAGMGLHTPLIMGKLQGCRIARVALLLCSLRACWRA
jgi:hypothetical protein